MTIVETSLIYKYVYAMDDSVIWRFIILIGNS